MKTSIEKVIQQKLKAEEKTIRNTNAIKQFLKLFPRFDALYGVFNGSKEALELEKYKLTLDQLLDLIVAIDRKLEGLEFSNVDQTIRVILDNIDVDEEVIGIHAATSNESTRELFERPVYVNIRDVKAKRVTGIKLDVDREMKIEKDLGNGIKSSITFGVGL